MLIIIISVEEKRNYIVLFRLYGYNKGIISFGGVQ